MPVNDSTVWVEAEHFTEPGGWFIDTQFVQQMGSAYLLAAGSCTPVEDAFTKITIPETGRYRLWVRAKNWLPEYNPGQFEVHVNGTPANTAFGAADTNDWTWEDGGDFDLEAGTVSLRLHDLTGAFGRCDAMVLTSVPDYAPPEELDRLQNERRRRRGISETPAESGDFDIVVIGAGPGGCPAAIAAARLGARVALVHDRSLVGGNAGDEINVPLNGASSRQPNAREGGIAEEIARLKAYEGRGRGYSSVLQHLIDSEPNISLFTNQRVISAQNNNEKRIESVTAIDTLEGTLKRFRGRLFIDCTGDSWVGYFAGAEYRLGREARSEYGESMAVEKADHVTMSGCVRGPFDRDHIRETDHPVSFTPPPWAYELPPEEEFGRIVRKPALFQWWIEHPGDIDDLWGAEEARDELIRIEFGLWNYMKNQWSGREQARNHELCFVPFINGRREGMRLMGDHVLTQQEAEQGVDFPDTVAHTGWPIDVHHPKGIFSGKEGPFQSNTQVPLVKFPYRCLYSRNIENLLMAGRNVSVTHVALGTARVESTIATFGQAAGTAAALCLKHDTTPRGIYEQHLEDLQQTLLKHDQYIPGLKNRDPADVARSGLVSASSARSGEIFDLTQGEDAEWVPLSTSRATLFPRDLDTRLPALYLELQSERTEPVELTVHVRGANLPWDFTAEDDIASAKAVVPPGTATWVEFPVNCQIEEDYVWLWLPACEGISWRRRINSPLDYQLAYGGGNGEPWTIPPRHQYYAVMTTSPGDSIADCGPRNIINGYSRIFDQENYMWASDPEEKLPQWIDVAFPEATSVNAIYLTFDTDMNNPPMTGENPARVPQCVRDYAVAVKDESGWFVVADVRDNFMRRRIHRFRNVNAEAVRVLVTATNGDPSARLFELRAYRE